MSESQAGVRKYSPIFQGLAFGAPRQVSLRCSHAAAEQNLAQGQPLAALRQTTKRARFRTRDRLFWIALTRSWRNGRSALMVVRPDTVIRWHRDWFRRPMDLTLATATGWPATD